MKDEISHQRKGTTARGVCLRNQELKDYYRTTFIIKIEYREHRI